jgi:SAM-dependent MidA family methyltransferase
MPPSCPLLPILQEEILASGPIPFRRFMELCLYHPQHGYYCSEGVKLGAAGDFYTSAHVAPVFARLLARHLEQCWGDLGRPERFDLVELGAGDGTLAGELLPWVRQRFPELFASLFYTGVERSARLRSRLEQGLSGFREKAEIIAELPESGGRSGFRGCVFANEFFDALPVHLLVWQKGRWWEQYVELGDDRLLWSLGKPSSPDLAKEAESRCAPALPVAERQEGWIAEVSPEAETYIGKAGQCLARGEMLIIDYGYTLEEWQRGRFPQGSALACRGHQVMPDLLADPGEQDLTAHVNFSQLMGVGRQHGLQVRCFESQAKFLMEAGEPNEFADIFADCHSEPERLRRSQLLKTLILPQGMGEAFRALAMRRES